MTITEYLREEETSRVETRVRGVDTMNVRITSTQPFGIELDRRTSEFRVIGKAAFGQCIDQGVRVGDILLGFNGESMQVRERF
jgi:hypothetical protein